MMWRALDEQGRATTKQSVRRGFTLPELLVVVGIVLILGTILVPYLINARETDRRTRCANNLRQIQEALSAYLRQNNNSYPRVVYDATGNPNGYTAFTGPEDPDPFAAGSAVRPNDVTASLWLLVRSGLVRPSVFVCPSSEQVADGLVGVAFKRGNFASPANLSYSYAQPFSAALGYRIDDSRPATFIVLADMNPGVSDGYDVTRPQVGSPPLELSLANSRNHSGAGQNILSAAGDVRFVNTPFCGVGGDNIYTTLRRAPLTGEQPLANGPGVCEPNLGPAWSYDAYLVPLASETRR
jgi:prepilin-type N-terminal cleavage/methylation domain-containing protein